MLPAFAAAVLRWEFLTPDEGAVPMSEIFMNSPLRPAA
jgi:hypothetical protein